MILPQGRGNPNAKLFFVGEAYGKHEAAEGKPFVGPAGKVLDELLLKSGINPADCYFSNIVNQQPPDNDLAEWYRHGVPNELVLAGLLSLKEEIERVQPTVIVPLGNWPLYAFYGQKLSDKGIPVGILDYRGYVLEARKLARGTKIIPTVHPSYINQGGYADSGLAILDLKRARREALAGPSIVRQARTCIIDPRGAEREAIRHRLLNEGRRLVVDIEYVGSRLLCVGFAVSKDWAVTIRIRSPEDLAWCKSLIECGRPLAAQNAMFDLGILDWHYNINVFKYLEYDTMVAAYVLNIEDKKDLGHLGGLYTDMFAWWDVIDWEQIKAGRQSIDLVWPYNCYDNMVTYEVMDKQEVELASDPKMVEAFKFDMAKLPSLWRMSKRGVLLDTAGIKELHDSADKRQAQNQFILNNIAETYGVDIHKTDLNVKSKPQVTGLLLDMGLKLTERTKPSKTHKLGQLKDDNKTLMEAYRTATDPTHRKVIEFILNIREDRDVISKTLEIEWDTDGRARCIYDSTKTTTRRLSSKIFFPTGKGSNLQNIPAPGSSPRYGTKVRQKFLADPGYEYGYADLKGAEFLIVAELTQDPNMLRFAQMSIDGTGNVHKETASFMFGMPVDEVKKDSPFYFLGKKYRHSGNYMIGPKKMMANINAEALETGVFVELQEVKEGLDRYHLLHPGLPVWWRNTEAELYQNGGLLRNLFGFPRRFRDRYAICLPEAVAFKPQSTVGDALNFGLLACDLDEALHFWGFQLLMNVHDAIGFQYPIENRDWVLPRVDELLSLPITFPNTGRLLTIPVETAVGPNWGDLTEWKRAA